MNVVKRNRITKLTQDIAWGKEILEELDARAKRNVPGSLAFNLDMAEYWEKRSEIGPLEDELNYLIHNFEP